MAIKNVYDVIIIGAGASGLMAGYELAAAGRKVLLLEARDRIGGRAHTAIGNSFSKPIEKGAEFVHGNLPLTLSLLKKAGISYTECGGDFWEAYGGSFEKNNNQIEDFLLLKDRLKDLKEDISVAQFIEQYLQDDDLADLRLTLTSYVEGYYAGNVTKASTVALCKELTGSDDEQYRIEGGYCRLMDYLAKDLTQKSASIYLSQEVKEIVWDADELEIKTAAASYWAKQVIVTVPLGVLVAKAIHFQPAIPKKLEAAAALGYGPVIKVVLQFSDRFWTDKNNTGGEDLSHFSFLFSEQEVPTWWTQLPDETALLTGWIAGPGAVALQDFSEEELLAKALASLSNIFSFPPKELEQKLTASNVTKWITDPYTLGGYSYEVVNGAVYQATLKEAEANKLFFTGEGLYHGPEIGTVEAALQMGQETARCVIAEI